MSGKELWTTSLTLPKIEVDRESSSCTPTPYIYTSYDKGEIMSRSTLFIIIKYSIFLNWTLTGFWIIYNSSDYSRNAQIISERISIDVYKDEIAKATVVYYLIGYTIIISSCSFFGLVGVCYENFYLTLSLAVGYLLYTIFDMVTNLLLGVPFGSFLYTLYFLLILNCIALFYLCYMIKSSDGLDDNFDASSSNIFNQSSSGRPRNYRAEPEEIDMYQLS